MAKETTGSFLLAINKEHLEEILQKYLVPQLNELEMQK